jgi:hypothetical protein
MTFWIWSSPDRDPGYPSAVRISILRDCCAYGNETLDFLKGLLVLTEENVKKAPADLLLGASMSKTVVLGDFLKSSTISCRHLIFFCL